MFWYARLLAHLKRKSSTASRALKFYLFQTNIVKSCLVSLLFWSLVSEAGQIYVLEEWEMGWQPINIVVPM